MGSGNAGYRQGMRLACERGALLRAVSEQDDSGTARKARIPQSLEEGRRPLPAALSALV